MTVSSFALAAFAAQALTTFYPSTKPAQQATIQPSAPAAVIAPAPQQAVILSVPAESVLRSGTEVPLIMAEGISSNDKSLRAGKQIRLQTANQIMLGGAVVIPAGSPATGEVTEVRRKGMWGKSGRIEARVLNVRVGDRLIRLTGSFDDKGVTGTAGVVGAIVFVPIAGFFLTGTSASIPAGSGIKAFLDEDLRIAVPAPVPAPAPAPVAAAVAVQASVPAH
jgi:hypothetical protein